MNEVQPQPLDLKAYADRLEILCRAQADEIVRLRDDLARATEGASAHATLQDIHRNRDLPESLRVKAAAAAIGYEQPKILSAPPAINLDRRERWRVYEMWAQRREYIFEHRAIPPRGWDAHLARDTFVEPEGTEMPPVDVILDATSGFKLLSNLLPKPGSQRKLGNGSDDSSSG
jgi:hypothetical protein